MARATRSRRTRRTRRRRPVGRRNNVTKKMRGPSRLPRLQKYLAKVVIEGTLDLYTGQNPAGLVTFIPKIRLADVDPSNKFRNIFNYYKLVALKTELAPNYTNMPTTSTEDQIEWRMMETRSGLSAQQPASWLDALNIRSGRSGILYGDNKQTKNGRIKMYNKLWIQDTVKQTTDPASSATAVCVKRAPKFSVAYPEVQHFGNCVILHKWNNQAFLEGEVLKVYYTCYFTMSGQDAI